MCSRWSSKGRLNFFDRICISSGYRIRTSGGGNEQGRQRAGEGFYVDHIYKLHQSRIVRTAHVSAELDDRTNAVLSVVYESEHGAAASGTVSGSQSRCMLYAETRADISLRRSNFL